MAFVGKIIDFFAPAFLLASPVTSYADQIYSIHKNKSSAGFSLDIPLIMLAASILKIFYWFGAHFSNVLLFQAMLMVVVQLILLKVALDNRPSLSGKNGLGHNPFSHITPDGTVLQTRPFNFWQWRSTRPYYQFLIYLTGTLLFIHLILTPIASSQIYISFLGYLGLAIEATLPLPQILTNQRAQSCKGFRFSVLANWLAGDAMKMSYFFLSSGDIPWAFRMCGMFQVCCDCYLGLQYWMFEIKRRGTEPRPVVDAQGNVVAMSEKDGRFPR